MNEIVNDGDPWTPVDTSTTSVEAVEPEPALEIKGGEVAAHINLGGDTAKEEEPPAEEEEKANAESATAEDSETEEDTTEEVEAAEATLAEKLAALDAAKTGKKSKK